MWKQTTNLFDNNYQIKTAANKAFFTPLLVILLTNSTNKSIVKTKSTLPKC